ncbi:MAG: efflux transporter, family, subunit, partial [Proteobacteria bacterium]|nr:efflux transporter, family, subunit [Pseudomonadota bacterium]
VAAEAQAARAGADARRIQNLFDKEAATQQTLDAALAEAHTAQAQVAEARAGIGAADSLASETVLRAPFDGAVVQRLLEPGDMAMPGSPVLILQSEQRLRIEAAIPESCARAIEPGQVLTARIGEKRLPVKVEEIAPAADPTTRTVLVKAALDDGAGATPGTFAWLEQSCSRRVVLQIPAGAVTRRGQLESVRVLLDGRARLRHVRTGKLHDGMIEVLSGLNEGDQVLVGGAK